MAAQFVGIEFAAELIGDGLGDEDDADIGIAEIAADGVTRGRGVVDYRAVNTGEAEAAHGDKISHYTRRHAPSTKQNHDGHNHAIDGDAFRQADIDERAAHQLGTFGDGAHGG